MERPLILAFVAALAILAPASVAVAAETPAATCMQPASGQDFGQHVAMHAQAGMLGGAMNPGMHQGYSTFVSR